ncbi:SUMF1/EgtB/PvdO family nonheme iron enzyme [Planctomicrobium sp. SH668]|uniref:formylglycine-generating enzyme family protein n=1 Tax=Planctomicrobium sp. SH668 TaxID=3448126 RepID=UPI003F5C69E3
MHGGVWALGQIGGSITYAHGAGGDDYGPNQQWERADDIMGCGALHQILGPEHLARERMPCVHYIDVNDQATARSQHPGGANLSFMDGSVRFVSDQIDSGLWHVMHARDTPPEVLARTFDDDLKRNHFDGEGSQYAAKKSPMGAPPEIVVNSIGMTLKRIPAGTFEMGIEDTGMGRAPADVPPHRVTLDRDFLMGIHEVTRSQYRQVMGRLPGNADSAEPVLTSETDGAFPVTNLTWYEADEFARTLSTNPDEVKAGRSYRLPTEAEWEYVCREQRQGPYQFNAVRQPRDSSGNAAGINPPLPLQPVGSYPANRYGIYDMRGNAWEWTADWFSRGYYSRSPEVNPPGPERGFLKVVRGSNWRFVGEVCHIDYPNLPPWKANPFVGFRVVCTLHDSRPEQYSTNNTGDFSGVKVETVHAGLLSN